MMKHQKRRHPLPDMSYDGEFLKPLPVEGDICSEKSWHAKLDPWQRMNSHYTYSSVRRFVHFKPFHIMKDRLDLVLNSTYQHNKELFPEITDVYFQPITVYAEKSKKGTVSDKYTEIDSKVYTSDQDSDKLLHKKHLLPFGKLLPDHPLRIGGVQERVHPSSVKLMNSSHHSPQTNAGYIRQDRDGNLFQY